jgi:integrase
MSRSGGMSSLDHDLLASGGLAAESLADSSRQRYRTALRLFCAHARVTLRSLRSMRSAAVDELLSLFFHCQYAERRAYAVAEQALSAIVFQLPHLRFKLHRARRALRGWNRIREKSSHPPLTWQLTVMIAVAMACRGADAAAVATLLAFDCYLRISEFTRLACGDVALPGDARYGGVGTMPSVRLARTKTGLNQYVQVREPIVAEIIAQYLHAYRFEAHDTPLFGFTAQAYRVLLHSVCSQLGLSAHGFVPHSLRHGGATRDEMRGATIEQIMHRGRWASSVTTRRYLQSGAAILMMRAVPSEIIQAAAAIEPHLPAVMHWLRHAAPDATAAPSRRRRRVRFAL